MFEQSLIFLYEINIERLHSLSRVYDMIKAYFKIAIEHNLSSKNK